MIQELPLLVIGAGPYGLSLAGLAIERSIPTTVVGRPMSFWREHMPDGMFLRSDADWHLDAAQRHTFRAFLEHKTIRVEDVDPVPIATFLEYTDWFARSKSIVVRDAQVRRLTHDGDGFAAELDGGETLRAKRVVVAPGIARFRTLPAWTDAVPAPRVAHTFEAVRFEDYAGQRVLIVGGRQSAYEWAALVAEHGAARVDVVHRHETPRFDQGHWQFVDELMANSLAQRGWWRRLSAGERDAIGRRFWEAGRLTLEHWLAPRIDRPNVRRWPRAEVVEAVEAPGAGELSVRLSIGLRLAVDRVVLATGYHADIARLPWLEGVLDRVRVSEGYPELDEQFQTSLPGLYMTGFVATRDFGPFFGFIRATPVSSALIVEDLLRTIGG